jgi:hypothetical protein
MHAMRVTMPIVPMYDMLLQLQHPRNSLVVQFRKACLDEVMM